MATIQPINMPWIHETVARSLSPHNKQVVLSIASAAVGGVHDKAGNALLTSGLSAAAHYGAWVGRLVLWGFS